jgi:alpha-tubulin suppressor-like RCC1 family protein
MLPIPDLNGGFITDAFRATKGTVGTTPTAMGIIRKDGTVWVAGTNASGELGTGNNITSPRIREMQTTMLNTKSNLITMSREETRQIESYINEEINVWLNRNIEVDVVYESLNTEIVTVGEETGLITAMNPGRTRVKITDKISELITYVHITVLEKDETLVHMPDVRAGANFSVALRSNGAVFAWGENGNGQLGNGTIRNTDIPSQVVGENGVGVLANITQIATGANHTLALDSQGRVWAWGHNDHGQLRRWNKNNKSYTSKSKKHGRCRPTYKYYKNSGRRWILACCR